MTDSHDLDPEPSDLVDFAHESERQFARLLDFYDIEWDYEPHEFPVEWDDGDNQPTKFFRPDFYLPEENVYIEITTMNQKLVTKKNKKVRRFRELYPDTNIKIFYQRDYLNLLVKYGLADDVGDEDVAAPTRIPGPPQVIDLGDAGDDVAEVG